MRINEIRNNLLEFVNEKLPNYTDKPFALTGEFLDFDKFKSDFTVFLDVGRLNFSYPDDCVINTNVQADFFLVVRNDTHENLVQKISDYSDSFFNMLTNERFGNRIVVNNINFYNYAAEGNKNIVISNIDINIEIELEGV